EETLETALEIDSTMPHGTKFYPEKQNYQQSALEIMEKKGITVVPMQAVGDKKSRIASACHFAKSGRVLFPKTGARDLLDNIVGFGIEEHDDFADAWAYLVIGMVKKKRGKIFA